jgi:hypothetical protein
MNYMVTFTIKEYQRFINFTTKEGDCVIWNGYRDKDGYGTFYFRKKQRKAHRVAYFAHLGEIADGMVIDHTCCNRACVNPQHLRQVTPRQNTMENSKSVGAINKAKTTCKQGHVFDKVYGTFKKQRYCSICENEKSKRLQKKWLNEANKTMC